MSHLAHPIMDTRRPFGGQYVPESLMDSLEQLEDAFHHYWSDMDFRQEFADHLAILRPTSQLQLASNLTKLIGGARVYLKREDLNYTGSHAIANALGQALLAKRINKSTIFAETASGNHGVATAAVCLRLGLECVVYMGMKDVQARPDQVKRMRSYGAKVVEVSWGEGTIREAVTEVLRAAVEKHEIGYPLLGGSYGPRPMPTIAKAFQSIIGAETKQQMLQTVGRVPDAVVACAGIHSSAVGLFDSFVENGKVSLVAVEGAGCGLDTRQHAAVLTNGSAGVYHGAHTLVLQDVHGQIEKVHSIAPDLCYPSTSPWLAKWTSEGRVEPTAVTDDEAVIGCAILSRIERIECSIEDGHAIVAAVEVAARMSQYENIVVCIGG